MLEKSCSLHIHLNKKMHLYVVEFFHQLECHLSFRLKWVKWDKTRGNCSRRTDWLLSPKKIQRHSSILLLKHRNKKANSTLELILFHKRLTPIAAKTIAKFSSEVSVTAAWPSCFTRPAWRQICAAIYKPNQSQFLYLLDSLSFSLSLFLWIRMVELNYFIMRKTSSWKNWNLLSTCNRIHAVDWRDPCLNHFPRINTWTGIDWLSYKEEASVFTKKERKRQEWS
jgi:hypothetical protein